MNVHVEMTSARFEPRKHGSASQAKPRMHPIRPPSHYIQPLRNRCNVWHHPKLLWTSPASFTLQFS